MERNEVGRRQEQRASTPTPRAPGASSFAITTSLELACAANDHVQRGHPRISSDGRRPVVDRDLGVTLPEPNNQNQDGRPYCLLTWIIDKNVGCDDVAFLAPAVVFLTVVGAIVNVSRVR